MILVNLEKTKKIKMETLYCIENLSPPTKVVAVKVKVKVKQDPPPCTPLPPPAPPPSFWNQDRQQIRLRL